MDENLHDLRLMELISSWYSGQVVSVTTLRPASVIKDDSIPTLLQQANQPTFVTINVVDFWKKVQPHQSYCIVTIALPTERIFEIPALLRRLFSLSEFKSKALRMGGIVRLTPETIEYYRSPQQIQKITWTD